MTNLLFSCEHPHCTGLFKERFFHYDGRRNVAYCKTHYLAIKAAEASLSDKLRELPWRSKLQANH